MYSKPRLWENGSLLLGITYFTLGLVVSTMAVSKLRDFFLLIVPNLPLTLPKDLIGFLLGSLPSVFSVFVSLVSSIAGFLFGIKWTLGGFSSILATRRFLAEPGELGVQENVVEFLNSSDTVGSTLTSLKDRSFQTGFTQKWFSPGVSKFASHVFVSNLKIVVVIILLLLLEYVLFASPKLIKQFVGIPLEYVVPAFTGLWILLGGLILINLILVISSVSLSSERFEFKDRNYVVSGQTAMVFLLSVFEDLCALLNPRDTPNTSFKRFVVDSGNGSYKLATLFESHPFQKFRPRNFLIYLLFPLSLSGIIVGFNSLIDFRTNLVDMDYSTFFHGHFLSMLVEVAIGCFLIMSGFYLLGLIRRMFDISRFESYIICCSCKKIDSSEATQNDTVSGIDLTGREFSKKSSRWRTFSGSDDDLIKWIKNPEIHREFLVKISWAKVTTEAPVRKATRSITLMEPSTDIQELIERLLKGLKKVYFEMEKTED